MMFVRRGRKLRLLLERYNKSFDRSLRLQKEIEQLTKDSKAYEYIYRDLVNAQLDSKRIDQIIYQTFLDHQQDEQVRTNQ